MDTGKEPSKCGMESGECARRAECQEVTALKISSISSRNRSKIAAATITKQTSRKMLQKGIEPHAGHHPARRLIAAPQSAQAIIRDVCNRAAAGAAGGDWECSWLATCVSRPQCGQNSVRSKPSDSKSFPQCSHLIVRIIFAARSSRANLSGKSDFDARKFHGWQTGTGHAGAKPKNPACDFIGRGSVWRRYTL